MNRSASPRRTERLPPGIALGSLEWRTRLDTPTLGGGAGRPSRDPATLQPSLMFTGLPAGELGAVGATLRSLARAPSVHVRDSLCWPTTYARPKARSSATASRDTRMSLGLPATRRRGRG